jgi:uncharacterized repeat protein (TIGR01451 family)
MKFHKQGAVMKNSIWVILMTIFSAVAVNAQEQTQLDIQTVVQKEEVTVNADVETEIRLVAASSVTPGERVVYTTTFRNIGEEPAENVVITNPIAETLTYLDGSAFGPGAAIDFSVDGGSSYAGADDLTVTEDGVSRAARTDDYTHIRWVMQNDLATGAQGVARFTAVLN